MRKGRNVGAITEIWQVWTLPAWERAAQKDIPLIQRAQEIVRLARLRLTGSHAQVIERLRARETMGMLAEILADAIEAEQKLRRQDAGRRGSRRRAVA